MTFWPSTTKGPTPLCRLSTIFLLMLCFLFIILFIASFSSLRLSYSFSSSLESPLRPATSSHNSTTPTSIDHIVFGISSSAKSWPQRKEYVRLWWNRFHMRGCVFVDRMPSEKSATKDEFLPPICISEDTSRFRYTNRAGYPSAIREARVVLETVALNHSNVRWFVFGDDDTVFFADNLVKTLSKYDHNSWFYLGSDSESIQQNYDNFFGMAFGGGGFAISYPLARVLANTLDSCLVRYPHLYGSDSRIFSCLTELGVGLTHEPGFHQVDIRGDAFGFLTAHPLTPLVSLHHFDSLDPIFPNMTRLQALQKLFEAVKFDSERLLQRTVCYDRWYSWTISISWGYSVQVIEANKLLPDLLSVERTFKPLSLKNNGQPTLYKFNTREIHNDPCNRPINFFLQNMSLDGNRTKSSYRRVISEECLRMKGPWILRLENITVFSTKMDLEVKQLQAPRRHCCDILSSSNRSVLEIAVRECGEKEQIFMHP